MLSIGNKKYRNLQEQVGFNTEQIEKIFDVLDGLAVTDNVVAIADLSDNLNADQLEIVQKSVAFLIYAGQVYIKKSEDSSKAYFDIVFTISSSGGVVSFNSKEIEVDLSTGALTQTTSTNATYSTSQIDTMVGAKADTTYVDAQLALKANANNIPFENIKDTSSHNRFVEGDITAQTIAGMTQTYGKWSLSGTHFLIVLGLSFQSGTILNGGDVFAYLVLPQWIKNKIYVLFGTSNVDKKTAVYYADDITDQTANVYLRKQGDDMFIVTGALTLTANRQVRIAFDLLIDND